MLQNKIRLHLKKYNKIRLQFRDYLISFLLLILIKNAIKNAITVIIGLYMVYLENPENQNSEIAANTSDTCT